MSEWGSITDILAVNGVAYPLIREAWNYIKYRKRRNDRLEESVMKDLWREVANLRAAVSAAQATLIEWQAKYVELLAQHKATVEQLAVEQQNFLKLSALLNEALRALDKIEEVERDISIPDLDKAKATIDTIKEQAETIRQKADILYQS